MRSMRSGSSTTKKNKKLFDGHKEVFDCHRQYPQGVAVGHRSTKLLHNNNNDDDDEDQYVVKFPPFVEDDSSSLMVLCDDEDNEVVDDVVEEEEQQYYSLYKSNTMKSGNISATPTPATTTGTEDHQDIMTCDDEKNDNNANGSAGAADDGDEKELARFVNELDQVATMIVTQLEEDTSSYDSSSERSIDYYVNADGTIVIIDDRDDCDDYAAEFNSDGGDKYAIDTSINSIVRRNHNSRFDDDGRDGDDEEYDELDHLVIKYCGIDAGDNGSESTFSPLCGALDLFKNKTN